MGQKTLAYGADGVIRAIYDSNDSPLPKVLPAGVTATLDVDDDQWLQVLSAPGWTIVDGELVEPIVQAPSAAEQAAQQVAEALMAGLTVMSSGTPAINGTYPLDAQIQFEVASVQLFIVSNGDFPGGAQTYPWFDVKGVAHVFTSIALFKAWSSAIADYIAALKLYAAGVAGATMPSPTVTIS